MFFDLNVPISTFIPTNPTQSQSKKGKGKQPQAPNVVSYTPAQISAIEARVTLLVHLGYTIIAFNQTVHKKIDPKTHINVLDGLLLQLKKRPGIAFLKRLTIILDQDSEKGFGLTNANAPFLNPYDLIALTPTTAATFSLACLTHSLPSPLTAHIIALPLTCPRLPYHLKHTLVRTAIKNGAVFEINYVGALGGENEEILVEADAAENGPGAKRNWWAAGRELTRVTKGKGLIVSGGVVAEADLRAPRDVGNLIALLGLAQDAAHASSTKTPKSLVLRAQTRKTFRAVLSEPRIVIPDSTSPPDTISTAAAAESTLQKSNSTPESTETGTAPPIRTEDPLPGSTAGQSTATLPSPASATKKRPRDNENENDALDGAGGGGGGGDLPTAVIRKEVGEKEKEKVPRKKKRRNNK